MKQPTDDVCRLGYIKPARLGVGVFCCEHDADSPDFELWELKRTVLFPDYAFDTPAPLRASGGGVR